MGETISIKIAKPIVTICLLLFAGSIVMISFGGHTTTSNNEVLNEFTINKNVQQAMQTQFYENLGQVQNSEVRFYGELSGLGVGFADSSVIYRLSSNTQDTELNPEPTAITDSILVTLSFDGANIVTPQGLGLLSHKSNYFYGNDCDEWFTGVRSYSEVVYTDLYNNIDLIYRVSVEGLKYEFVIWPDGNPSDIRLHYEGIDGLSVDEDGSLVADTSLGPIIDRGLFIYQDTQLGREEVVGEFVRKSDSGFGFHIIDDYDTDIPLVIDPFLHYSTFVGGSNDEYGYSIALDSSNNSYVTGHTRSSNFPTTSGANDTTHNSNADVFILKLSADGSTLLYSTYVGGSSEDWSFSLALDGSDNAYVTGYTFSSNFPITSGANDTSYNVGADVFILKLSADGSILLYSTFVGGSSDEVSNSIALDSSDNAYVTGFTFSSNFPITSGANDTTYNGNQDVFILKLSADGSTLLYSTYVGGGSDDWGYSVALDSSNNSYVTGYTSSSNFPTTSGANDTTHNSNGDVFILKLSADGSTLLYSTYVGGGFDEYGYSIALDSSNNAYVTGKTASGTFPTTIDAYDTTFSGATDAFVLKLNAEGSTLLYSTFIGGTFAEGGESIALDGSDNAYVTGYTYSSNYPTTSGANDTTYNGNQDVFILKLSADGSTLLYSTFVGGGSDDCGYSVALDSSNNTYITGLTSSSNFPTTSGANDTTHNSNKDVFVLKIDIRPIEITIGVPSNTTYTVDFIIVDYAITSKPSYTIEIFFDGVSNVTAFPSGSLWSSLSDGSHNLTIIATSINTRVDIVTVIFTIDTTYPDVDSPMDLTYVEDSVGNYINWTIGDKWPGQYLIEGNGSTIGLTPWSENMTISFNIDGLTVGFVYNHTITVYDAHGNYAIDTVFVKVIERTELSSPLDVTIEIGTTEHYLAWTIGNVWWPFPDYRLDGNATIIDWTLCTSNTIVLSIDNLDLGVWNFTITVMDQFSYYKTDTVFVTVIDTISPYLDSPLGVVYSETATGNSITWTPYDLRPESYEILRNGSSIQSGTWDGSSITIDVDGLSAGIYNYTLTVSDSSGNNAFHSVMVVVLADSTTTTDMTTPLVDTTLFILGASGAGLCLVVVVLLLFKRKQS